MRREGIYVCIYINAHQVVKINLYTYNTDTIETVYRDTIETNKAKDDISK